MLLLFCKFLAQRVRTENLDLLYNIAVDFLDDPPCFIRVDEMIYRVFPLVAIVPTEITDPSSRAKADKLLKRMLVQNGDLADENELHDLGVALGDRIVLKNWGVLEQIFADFKMGRDHTLRAFVALQPQAIAIVPVLPSKHTTLDHSKQLSSPGRSSTVALESEMKPDPGILEMGEHELPVPSGKTFRRFTKDTPPAIYEIARAIRVELDAIEASKSWARVYDVAKIAYPFDETKHPSLAARFQRFWTRHARAVWQRHFWYRVPVESQDREYKVLLDADKYAVCSFQDLVLRPLFEAFGAEFFLQLDARPTRIHWWWYREPIVDLVKMASIEGIAYCKRYMRTQSTVAHPTPQPQFYLRMTNRNPPSASMWSMTQKTRDIREEIVASKQRESRRYRTAPGNRKRSRAAPRESEEDDV